MPSHHPPSHSRPDPPHPRPIQLSSLPPLLPPPTSESLVGAGRTQDRFLDPSGLHDQIRIHGRNSGVDNQGLSKRRKAERYRQLTCPRTRTSQLPDGTKIVTVGSHVLVYPSNNTNGNKSDGKPKSSSVSSGQVMTTFEEHPIWQFPDDSFKHYSLGVGLYFKGVRLLAIIFAICAIVTLPNLILALLSNPSGSDSGLYLEKTSVGNFQSLLTLNSTRESTWGSLPSDLSREQLVLILSTFDTTACVVLLLFGVWLSRRQESETKAYSKREITVKKYSVEVRNLPPFFHDRVKLANWFQERFGEVVDCAITYDQHDLLQLFRARGILRKDVDMAISHGETGRLDHLYHQLDKIDLRIHEVQKDLPYRHTLGAYITFEHQESRIKCERAFSNVFLKNLTKKWRELDTNKEGNDLESAKSLLFGRSQRVLKVKQAPEPSNVLFKVRLTALTAE